MRPFSGTGALAAFAMACGCAGASPAAPASTVFGSSAFGVVSEAPYAPEGSRTLVVHSAVVGRDFVVVVTPPPAEIYNVKIDWRPEQKLPAIYALDGGYGIAGSLGQMMGGHGVMAPAYVISISYLPGESAFRDTDLLFRKGMDGTELIGGGGQTFADFITRELRPFLEARFAIAPEKAVLFGHSFGGLFALNVLATEPNAFDSYIIASPSVWRDPDVMAGLAESAKAARGKRVYVSVGGKEGMAMIPGAAKVATILKAAGVTVESHVFENEGHLSYYPQLVPAAFAWILPADTRPAADAVVTQAQLDRLVGGYKFDDGRIATFTSRDGKLVSRITNLPGEAVLDAETPTRFVITAYGVVMIFEGAENGPANGLTVRINGADSHATRQ